MTKTLEQIQDENRKLIILKSFAENEDSFSMFDEIKSTILSHPNFTKTDDATLDLLASDLDLTFNNVQTSLDRVLIALESRIDDEDIIRFNIKKEYKAIFFEKDGLGITEILWDLTKPTLELQTEETQIAINELLT